VQTLASQCNRTELNKVFQSRDVFTGVAKYMKPNMAMLEMRHKTKPEIVEKYVCTGTFLYEYVPSKKEVRVHELPAPKSGQVADDNFLSFLFGMKAEEAKRRYDLKLAKEDQWYFYVEITPRFQVDKADFTRARLVLLKDRFLPRQLWFEQPNTNEVTWDIERIDSGARLDRNDFAPPTTLPAGWVLKREPKLDPNAPRGEAPRDPSPRVIRPNQ
jgi:TIGR03009 family protein